MKKFEEKMRDQEKIIVSSKHIRLTSIIHQKSIGIIMKMDKNNV